jgi:hypothetical protein
MERQDGVTGGEILAQLVTIIRRYIFLAGAEAYIIALWVVHTYAFNAADATPYLEITSAEKQCGKTNLIELLDMLAAKPWMTGSVSAAVLFRKIHAERPTLLLDESDATFNGSREYAEALRGILNSGYRRGGKTSRCVQEGKDYVPRDFETFCPKVFAGIGRLPDTVADRSIPIRLKRKLAGEATARFRRREVEAEAAPLREQMAAWTQETVEQLQTMRPILPEALNSRQQDCSEPLIAIADVVGGDWPETARASLVEILGGKTAEDQSSGTRLLSDIRDIFTAENRDRLSSQELLGRLVHEETLQWGEFANGRAMSLIGLARLLKPFGIQPGTLRLGSRTFKGYLRESFAEAWARYLPNHPPQPSHRHNPRKHCLASARRSRHKPLM